MASTWGQASVNVRVEGVSQVSRAALKMGVSLSDLTAFNYRQAKPLVALARSLAPTGKTRRLRGGIRPVRSKTTVGIRLGNKGALKYAAVVHWGRDGHTGPKFMSVAEERLRPSILAAYDTEMKTLLKNHGWM